MMSPFVRKLQAFAPLSPDELRGVQAVVDRTVKRSAGDDLVSEGDPPRQVHLLLEGWAYRYKILPDGRRQIMAYLLPGDLCDIHVFMLNRMDHSLGLLSDARVALISPDSMQALLDTYPRIARALLWSTLIDEAILREWLVNALRRDPFERVAHLFCELRARMNTVGLIDGRTFDLPLTQAELGDTLGLNAVTINRVLQRLRAEDLIELARGQLTIMDIDRLAAISGFNPNYLHLDHGTPDAGAPPGRNGPGQPAWR